MARFGIRCECDGYKFDSEPERDFYLLLVKLRSQGLIKAFEMQVSYPIQEEFTTEFEGYMNVKIQPISYVADYVVTILENEEIIIDSKGQDSIEETSQIKRKLLLHKNRNIPIYFVGKLPIYLGGVWVEVSKGADFLAKLKNKYSKLYPQSKGNKSKPVKWNVKNWEEYFEFESICGGAFWIWSSTKKIKSVKKVKSEK